MSEFYPKAIFDDLLKICQKHGITWIGSRDMEAYLDTPRGRYAFTLDRECGVEEIEFKQINKTKVYRPRIKGEPK